MKHIKRSMLLRETKHKIFKFFCSIFLIAATSVGVYSFVSAQSGLTTTHNYNDLPINYVSLPPRLPLDNITDFSTTNSNFRIINDWTGSGTNSPRLFSTKAIVYHGPLTWGDRNTGSTQNASMGTKDIDGSFSFRYPNIAELADGTKADLFVTVSAVKIMVGDRPSGVGASDSVYQPLFYGSTYTEMVSGNPRKNTSNTSAIETTTAQSFDIELKVLQHGTNTPIDQSTYPTMLFGMNDLDVVDHRIKSEASDSERYAGAYAEGITFLSGWISPIYTTSNTLLRMSTTSAGNDHISGTQEDANTMRSGFVAGTNTSSFKFRWYGSNGASGATTADDGRYPGRNMGTMLAGIEADTVTVLSKAGTGGQILFGGQNVNNVTKEYAVNSTPTYSYKPNFGYRVNKLTVDGVEQDLSDLTYEEATQTGSSFKFPKLQETSNDPDHRIEVEFAPNLYVNYQWIGDHPYVSVPGSALDLAPGSSHTVDTSYNTSTTITNQRHNGQLGDWTFNGWSKWENALSAEGNINPNSPGSITVNANTTIYGSWTFHPYKFEITTEVVNGTIDPDVTNIEPNTSEVVISYQPNERYILDSITVDGENVPISYDNKTSYTFFDITENHHIKVVYKAEPRYDVSYEWVGEHPNKTVPAGQTDILSGTSYNVDTTYTSGQRVDEPKGNQSGYWTFNGWDKTGTLTITSNVVIKGQWTFHPTYKITTSVVGGIIDGNITDIDAGQSKTINYSPNVGYQLKTITVDGQDVEITDANKDKTPFNNINSDHDIRVVYELIPKLKITKTADPTVVNAGDTVNYTIVLEQTVNGAEARDVKVEDQLPEGLTLVQDSLAVPQGATAVIKAEHSYSFIIPSISGNKITFTYQATSDKTLDSNALINTVKAKGSNTPQEVQDTAEVTPVKPDATIAKAVSKQQVKKGDEVEYTITIKQTTNGAILRNMNMTDRIPAGPEVIEDSISVSDTEAEVNYEKAGSEDNESSTEAEDQAAAEYTGMLTVTKAELSDAITISFKAKVTAKKGEIKNIAILTGDDIEEKQDDAIINISSPVLVINKTADKKSVYKDDIVTYTIKAHAEGGVALNAIVKDQLPEEVALDESSIDSQADDYAYDKDSHTLTFKFNELSTEQIMTFKVKVIEEANEAMDIENVATLSADDCEEVKDNAIIQLIPPVIAPPETPKTGYENMKESVSLSTPIISAITAIMSVVTGIGIFALRKRL